MLQQARGGGGRCSAVVYLGGQAEMQGRKQPDGSLLIWALGPSGAQDYVRRFWESRKDKGQMVGGKVETQIQQVLSC